MILEGDNLLVGMSAELPALTSATNPYLHAWVLAISSIGVTSRETSR
jgi:hypothetical protein